MPQGNDTTWLECTAKNLPVGYLSTFTGNHHVLLLGPDGGHVVVTKGCSDSDNKLGRKAVITIGDNDDIHAVADLTYSGYWWDAEVRAINDKPKSQLDEHMNKMFAISTYAVTGYDIKDTEGNVPQKSEHVLLAGSGAVRRSGKMMIVSPAIFKRITSIPASHEERKIPFELRQTYDVSDTILLNLPPSYIPDALPKEINLQRSFASFHAKVFVEGSATMKIIIAYHQQHGVYPATQFADYVKFCREVNSGLGDIVLTKND